MRSHWIHSFVNTFDSRDDSFEMYKGVEGDWGRYGNCTIKIVAEAYWLSSPLNLFGVAVLKQWPGITVVAGANWLIPQEKTGVDDSVGRTDEICWVVSSFTLIISSSISGVYWFWFMRNTAMIEGAEIGGKKWLAGEEWKGRSQFYTGSTGKGRSFWSAGVSDIIMCTEVFISKRLGCKCLSWRSHSRSQNDSAPLQFWWNDLTKIRIVSDSIENQYAYLDSTITPKPG